MQYDYSLRWFNYLLYLYNILGVILRINDDNKIGMDPKFKMSEMSKMTPVFESSIVIIFDIHSNFLFEIFLEHSQTISN